MESCSDTASVKEEPYDNWPDACEDYNFDAVDYCKAENFEALPLHEISAKRANETATSRKRSDKNLIIEFECKDVKIEPPSLSTTIVKSENQNCSPIVKMENEQMTNFVNEKSHRVKATLDNDLVPLRQEYTIFIHEC
ncbi:uncharacterized protein LOC111693247 [Trichogramma pretiosum]|uniref:uncharacterized protein LOC111693247 n=1 Tax=Trichogramma pretiosum TaxID=7493 RepID=UPI000C719D71|nr:uncharacterized protein LOC111693247 [Trichogramma pretiosum]